MSDSKSTEPKYIPAVKIVDHFGKTAYELGFSTHAFSVYQEALNSATHEVEVVRKRDPIRRVDGFEFRDKSVVPVVLKEVKVIEDES